MNASQEWNDKNFVLNKIKEDGEALESASDALKNDKELVKMKSAYLESKQALAEQNVQGAVQNRHGEEIQALQQQQDEVEKQIRAPREQQNLTHRTVVNGESLALRSFIALEIPNLKIG